MKNLINYLKNLTDLNEVQSLYQMIEAENIFIDFLVNNAGFGDYGHFVDSDWHKTNQMISTFNCRLSIDFLKKIWYVISK